MIPNAARSLRPIPPSRDDHSMWPDPEDLKIHLQANPRVCSVKNANNTLQALEIA